MRNFVYHSFRDDNRDGLNMNSRDVTDEPFALNCAGSVSFDRAFNTFNQVGREDYYLMYIIEGKLRAQVGDEYVTALAGDIIIFPPHYKYKYYSSGGRISYYFLHFSGYRVQNLLSTLGFSSLPNHASIGISASVKSEFDEIFSSYIKNGNYRDLALGISVQKVLLALAQHKEKKEKRAPLERSVSYIKSHYNTEIKIPNLANMENLSVSRYNAVFKDIYGISPVRYITDLRLTQACSLLQTTNLNVKEIAAEVGYDDNCFFSKIFKCRFGVSPKRYREKNEP